MCIRDSDRTCWDLATDIAVEKVILDLHLSATGLQSDFKLRRQMERLQKEVPMLTAEKIYRYFLDHPQKTEEYLKLEELFAWDEHLLWLPKKEDQARERKNDCLLYTSRCV